MTQVAAKPRPTTDKLNTARRDPAAAAMRDLAFVLAMTRRIKDSLLDGRPHTQATGA